MIANFEIKNFRCFKAIKQSLKRFNFIVGESGTGKTALLEALFLAGGGNPEIWFRLRKWRGLGEGAMEIGVRETYEALFRDIFFDFDQKQVALVRIGDSNLGNRELAIFYEGAEVYTLPLKGSRPENTFAIDPITFKWDIRNKIVRSQVEIREGAFRMTGAVEVYPIFMIAPQTFSAKANAQWYSNLSRRKKAAPILRAVKSIFNEVEDISLEIVAGEPLLHVSIPRLQEKIPLGDLSGGLTKYISLIIAILTNPRGVVLIDEIEDGFYYENLPDLLDTIATLCEENDVQIVATTHSYEFLQVMSKAMAKSEKRTKNTVVLRLERGQDQPTIRTISGESYEAAIGEQFEIR